MNICRQFWLNTTYKSSIRPATSSANTRTHSANHYPYLLTAGHCVAAWSWNWATANSSNTVGYVLGRAVAGVLGEGKDAGVISSYTPEVYDVVWAMNGETPTGPASNEYYYVTPSPATAYNGLFECHVGKTTGTQCGTVEQANIPTSIEYESHSYKTIQHTDVICALSGEGDSGGPVLSNYYGTAILLAGSGISCGNGGVAIGYELAYALADLDVHLPNN